MSFVHLAELVIVRGNVCEWKNHEFCSSIWASDCMRKCVWMKNHEFCSSSWASDCMRKCEWMKESRVLFWCISIRTKPLAKPVMTYHRQVGLHSDTGMCFHLGRKRNHENVFMNLTQFTFSQSPHWQHTNFPKGFTNCGLMMPYGNTELCQNWLR